MVFDLYGFLMNPFVLVFITVAVGLTVGQIRFAKISLGTSGALFVGLLFGWIVSLVGEKIIVNGVESRGYDAAIKMVNEGVVNSLLFSASLIIFVAAVGLLAGKDIGIVIKKYGITFIILGLIITFVGAGTTYAASVFVKGINSYEIVGIYTGALTSSPSLAAALETAEKHATDEMEEYKSISDIRAKFDEQGIEFPRISLEDTIEDEITVVKESYVQNAVASVGLGHAIGYPFGLIAVIFTINIFPTIFKINLDEEKKKYRLGISNKNKGEKQITAKGFSILAFSVTCLLGFIFGSLTIKMGPLGYFNLGITGGVLIAALLLSFIGKIGPLSFRMDIKILGVIRELALAVFLAIVGLKYGYMAVETLFGSGAILAAMSLFIGVLSILIGFIVGRYVFKLNWVILSGALCGGMTSTPGLGVCIDTLKSDDPAAGYGATYPFALFGMIIYTIIIHSL